jgi:pimeloyl-ACP methyl ester carboxylesterase
MLDLGNDSSRPDPGRRLILKAAVPDQRKIHSGSTRRIRFVRRQNASVRLRRVRLPNGIHVAGLDLGPLRPPAGGALPPLVLLHGVGADKGEWALAAPLLARRRRVFAPDLLGHGDTDKPSGPGVDYRIRLLADVVVSALERLPDRPARIDLLGHSLGGAVALDLVRRHSRLVRRLVLVDSAGLPPKESIDILAASLPFAPQGFEDSRRLLATTVASRWLGHPLVALAASAYKGRRRNRPQLLKLLAAIAAGEDALSPRDLARIRHTTLVLWGDRDRVFPLATGRRLATALPAARLEILPRCGHVPPTERPFAFVRRVAAFLDAP